MSEVTDENFVDRGDDHFLMGLVGGIVLVEDCGGHVMVVAKVGDLGSRRNRWYGGLGAGVNRSNEGRGLECCVHDGGDSALQ